MHVAIVHIHVKPEHLDAFLAATLANQAGSSREPGNLRFDVLQAPDDPTRLLLYEVYADADAAAAHKETAHYHAWRETVADWFAEPRVGVPWTPLAVGTLPAKEASAGG
jgi:(4S)-4-hydroxy-5-phosphonooxypentane-2,3-dione isomerase